MANKSNNTSQIISTFLLSGAEDLVPVAEWAGVIRYRPRTEGSRQARSATTAPCTVPQPSRTRICKTP